MLHSCLIGKRGRQRRLTVELAMLAAAGPRAQCRWSRFGAAETGLVAWCRKGFRAGLYRAVYILPGARVQPCRSRPAKPVAAACRHHVSGVLSALCRSRCPWCTCGIDACLMRGWQACPAAMNPGLRPGIAATRHARCARAACVPVVRRSGGIALSRSVSFRRSMPHSVSTDQ